MDIETTVTDAGQSGQDQEAAAAAAKAAAETAPEVDAGQDQDVEEKTPEQLEEERKAAEVAKSKANTDVGVQKRIDKEVRKRKDQEELARQKAAEAAYWRGVAEGKGHKPVGAQAGQPIDDDPEPKPEDYPDGSFNEYAKALAAHAARKAVREERANETKRQQEQTAREKAREHEERRVAAVEKGKDEFDDFTEVVGDPRLQVTTVMAGAATDAGENAHKIMYHLGKNPEVAAKIASMNPLQQVREIIKLDDAIRAASQPKTASSAPPPLAKVTGNAESTINRDKQSIDEWMAEEETRERQRRSRGTNFWRK